MNFTPVSRSDAFWLKLQGVNPPVVTAVIELENKPSLEQIDAVIERASQNKTFDRAFSIFKSLYFFVPLRERPPVIWHNTNDYSLVFLQPVKLSSPWEVHVFTGSKNFLVLRIHHALGDGGTLIEAFTQLTEKSIVKPQAKRNVLEPLLAVGSSIKLLKQNKENYEVATSTNKIVATPQVYPLDKVLSATRKNNITINTLLMKAIGHASETVTGEVLHAVVPVARPVKKFNRNNFGLAIIKLPDKNQSLKQASVRLLKYRHSGQPFLISQLTSIIGFVPGKLGKRLAKGSLNVLSRRSTYLVSNVTGPNQQAEIVGLKIKSLSFHVPQIDGVPVSVSALSYNKKLTLSIYGDDTFPINRFAAELKSYFDMYVK